PRWILDSLVEQPLAGVQIAAAEAATEQRLARIHTAEYLAAVRTGEPSELAESQGFPWDPGIFRAGAMSAGAATDAARAALRDGAAGALSTGLHHAAADHGAGYCTFNGLALAALEALDAGAQSVLILDLDAHCGRLSGFS
ncbi:MAG TPA: hypothetical protein VMU66_01150, partial [Gaiellales bacterium]|nr:hypothetical protein [Gaiellales bacterium]